MVKINAWASLRRAEKAPGRPIFCLICLHSERCTTHPGHEAAVAQCAQVVLRILSPADPMAPGCAAVPQVDARDIRGHAQLNWRLIYFLICTEYTLRDRRPISA